MFLNETFLEHMWFFYSSSLNFIYYVNMQYDFIYRMKAIIIKAIIGRMHPILTIQFTFSLFFFHCFSLFVFVWISWCKAFHFARQYIISIIIGFFWKSELFSLQYRYRLIRLHFTDWKLKRFIFVPNRIS